MIASLRGTVLSVAPQQAVIEVQGLGYAVQITPGLAAQLRVGGEAALRTALIVREDAMTLFGFATAEELAVFELLLGVSGVGPRSALAVLGALGVDEIAAAIAAEDDAPFRRVSGIGPKTAKLITVSLAGKLLAPAAPARSGDAPAGRAALQAQVLAALVGLGWPERLAGPAAETAVAAGAADAAAALRIALAELGPAGAGVPR